MVTEVAPLRVPVLTNRSQASTLKALGTSLAEVAAFMHEMELAMGLQGKRGRIEQLRLLALKMQGYLVVSWNSLSLISAD